MDSETGSALVGLVLWSVLIGGSLLWARWAKQHRKVSRNPSAKWEQDVPYPECFDNYQESEDDL